MDRKMSTAVLVSLNGKILIFFKILTTKMNVIFLIYQARLSSTEVREKIKK